MSQLIRRFFEARKVSCGAQSRPQEPRRGAKSGLAERKNQRSGQESRKKPQDKPKSPPTCPQELPRGAQEAPKRPQEHPKSTPEGPKSPPRDPQERPKEAQDGPKTLSIPSSDRKRRFFRIRRMSKLKRLFLRLGKSVVEPKVAPQSAHKRPNITPRRSQDHLRIESVDF